MTKIRKIWRICLLLGLLPAGILLSGCQDRQAARLQVARSGMENQLSALRRNNDSSPFCQHMIEGLTEGLKKLDKLPGGKIDDPALILGIMVAETMKDGLRYRLGAQWLANDFDVTGFYLLDKAGNVTEFPGVFFWDREEMGFLACTAYRENWVPVIMDASDKGWQNEMVVGRPAHPILIPMLDYAKGEVRLGLLTKAGRDPSTVVVGYGKKEAAKEMGNKPVPANSSDTAKPEKSPPPPTKPAP